jgi:hypothetical protein
LADLYEFRAKEKLRWGPALHPRRLERVCEELGLRRHIGQDLAAIESECASTAWRWFDLWLQQRGEPLQA